MAAQLYNVQVSIFQNNATPRGHILETS